MCGHFIMVPRDVIEIIVREIEIENHVNVMPDWPARRLDAFPQSMVPLIVPKAGRLTVEDMSWGYPVPWKSGVVFNTRSETALGEKGGMWRDSLLHRRCVIPSFGFFEPHRTEKATSERSGREVKRQYRFDGPNRLLFMGGIFENGHFSLMTTAPNDVVSPVHDRMPLVLLEHEIPIWLSPDFEALFDRTGIALTSTPVQPLAADGNARDGKGTRSSGAASNPEQPQLWS